jgi:hypothetical protein
MLARTAVNRRDLFVEWRRINLVLECMTDLQRANRGIVDRRVGIATGHRPPCGSA